MFVRFNTTLIPINIKISVVLTNFFSKATSDSCQSKGSTQDHTRLSSVNKSKSSCRLWNLSAYTMDTFNSVFLVHDLHPYICDVGFSGKENHTVGTESFGM